MASINGAKTYNAVYKFQKSLLGSIRTIFPVAGAFGGKLVSDRFLYNAFALSLISTSKEFNQL